MRWNKVGVIGVLVIFLFLVSCAPSPGPSKGVWDTILNIGSLEFLCRGGITASGCDFVGGLISLMRVLIGIVIFALLYMGASAVPGLSNNRNIAITVSLILAIISVIFIPSEVLVGIGAAYSLLFSVILIGAPIVGGLLLFRAIPGDSRGGIVARIIILCLLIWGLALLKHYAGGVATLV
ncbi:MAG TPA: hypothetical protein VJB13_01685 [Candidatus Nanoarchaeia archaeon]|nr:hypothetical protein [Candidatus Nanoarchaeia archaeon]